MFTEDVKQRWAAKLEKLSALPALALPHSSMTALAMSGRANDPELLGALRLVVERFTDELPLDGGPAKCRAIDEAHLAAMTNAGTRPRLTSIRTFEAAWLATDLALLYITPSVGAFRRWAWDDVTLRPVKKGRRFSRVSIQTADADFLLGLGTAAMANLLAIYSWTQVTEVADARRHPGAGPPQAEGLVYAFGATCGECGHKWHIEFGTDEAREWATVAAQSEPTWSYDLTANCPTCGSGYTTQVDIESVLERPPWAEPVGDQVDGDDFTTVQLDHGVHALICDQCRTDNVADAPVCRGCGRRIDWLLSGVAGSFAAHYGYVPPKPGDPLGHPAERHQP